MSGAPRGAIAAGAPELEDAQDEVAWRMGQWAAVGSDDGQQAAGDAAEGGRFNHAVLRTLRALAVGDHASCQELLMSARRVNPAHCVTTCCEGIQTCGSLSAWPGIKQTPRIFHQSPEINLGAAQGVVASPAGLSLESASAVNPAIVRLQMLRSVAEAWQLRWPALSLGPRSPGASQPISFLSAAPTIPADEDWQEAERRWRAREAQSGGITRRLVLCCARICQAPARQLDDLNEAIGLAVGVSKVLATQIMQFDSNVMHAGAGGRYDLAEPLLALRGVLAKALDRPELAVDVALQAARQARKAGDLPSAMSALHSIKQAAATCASGCAGSWSSLPDRQSKSERHLLSMLKSAATLACEGGAHDLWQTTVQKDAAAAAAAMTLHNVQVAGDVGADDALADRGGEAPVGSGSAGPKPAGHCCSRSPQPCTGPSARRQCRNTRPAPVPRRKMARRHHVRLI